LREFWASHELTHCPTHESGGHSGSPVSRHDSKRSSGWPGAWRLIRRVDFSRPRPANGRPKSNPATSVPACADRRARPGDVAGDHARRRRDVLGEGTHRHCAEGGAFGLPPSWREGLELVAPPIGIDDPASAVGANNLGTGNGGNAVSGRQRRDHHVRPARGTLPRRRAYRGGSSPPSPCAVDGGLARRRPRASCD
jgi:hypothetical protein